MAGWGMDTENGVLGWAEGEFRIQNLESRRGTAHGAGAVRTLLVGAPGVRDRLLEEANMYETGEGGKRRGGKRVDLGKWTGFSHLETALTRLFPHKSTQVVDFPRLSVVRVFSKDENSPPRRRDAEPRGGKS